MSEMQFPITVNAIKFETSDIYSRKLLFGGQCGDWVAVRPCDKELGDRTFLGVLIGQISLRRGCQHDPESGDLSVVNMMGNPAIYVPDLKRVVFGYESWWGKIKDPEGLKQITDADINDVWYVQALKALSEAE